MAKSKDEEAEKSDGIEIISIGSLYTGPWDKKYWSSSRGKDRYPYPVGYQAHRVYNGATCKMEIQEGHKGPLFVITSAEGHLCSGQTADIVWEKFQKKGCPRMKILHGKRSSCKMDGIEFFGFRNPFVQRLLRELVANVNGIAERSMLSSRTCLLESKMEQKNQSQDSLTFSDLPPCLSRPQITGKRSKRCKVIDPKSLSSDGLEKLHDESLTCIVESSNSVHGNPEQGSSLSPPQSSFHQKDNSSVPIKASTGMQLQHVPREETCHISAIDGMSFKYVYHPDRLREKAAPLYEESRFASSEDKKSIEDRSKENPLDRVQESEFEGLNFPASLELKALGPLCPGESSDVHDISLCAPDTLDFVQDNTDNSAPNTCDKITTTTREELMATTVADSEDLVNISSLKEETGISGSHMSSETSDFDSAGQDIAKSMMTFLLPQAIPLLKKTSAKKRRTVSPSGNNETGFFVQAQTQGIDHSVIQSSELIKSVVLDTFDDEQCEDYVVNKLILPSSDVEADESSCDKDAYPPKSKKQFVNANKESWAFHVETSMGTDALDDDQMQMNSLKRPQEGDQHSSEPIVGCVPACEKVLIDVNQDVRKNPVENSLDAEIHSEDIKAASHCIEAVGMRDGSVGAMGNSLNLSRKDTITKAGESGVSNISSSQVPKRVYARKKVPNTKPLARKHDPSPLANVGCRSLTDGYIAETTGALPPSEPSLMSFSVVRLHKKEVSGADTMAGEVFHGLHADKTFIASNPVSDSHAPFRSAAQNFDCSSEAQNASNLFVPSVSSIENSKPNFQDCPVGHENNLHANNHESLKQGALLCHNKALISEEVQGNLDMKIKRNLELNNEIEDTVAFLGCYFHPMPVLSLLLSRIGNEVYVCALCGFLVNTDRTLFLYKLVAEDPSIGCPCFIGHTSITWPSSTDIFGRDVVFERSGLQLAPDGKCLVLLGNARTPYCREGRIDCLCSACTSDCIEDNTVKIVKIQDGHVSVLLKLRTTESLQCILVCEPNHLIAAGESRRLHLWTMNSSWSAPTEEFSISSSDYISPCILELKRIPGCASLVIGHNGFDEFTLWDIARRIFISRFSAPGTSAYQFCPISVFGWPREDQFSSYPNVEACINKLIDETKIQFSEHSKNRSSPPLEDGDIAIWCLVSAGMDSDAHKKCESSEIEINPTGWWRLALLLKNTIIFGSALDTRISAISSSAGCGIIGTLDGLVYMWDLLTGDKLGTLHDFKGGRVSCIATDDSGSGVVAVADESGQLLVYRRLPCVKK